MQKNESQCILLSATPYNKTYLDLSSQLRLFVPDRQGPRHPARSACFGRSARRSSFGAISAPLRSLAAFEKSEYADDWRELMRLYMVRRTRSFIKDNYAETDPANGRKYLDFRGRHALLLP